MDERPSRMPIRILIGSVGEAEGELVRFSAPLTIGAIMRRMPVEGRAYPQRGGYSFIVGLRRGTEKAVKSVKEGDIAYWPMGDAINIYTSDSTTVNPVNTIGRVTSGFELFNDLKSGTRIKFELVK